MEIVEPKPEFRQLDESAVLAALQDRDPSNPVAQEVARLIKGYTGNFQRVIKQLGYMPADVMHIKPRWPIEGVAMRLTTDAIRDSLGSGRD